MIQLMLFLALGVVFLVLLYVFARRATVRPERGAEALLEARHALHSLQNGLLPVALVERVFARDDLDFVSSTCSPEIRKRFLRERRSTALQWVRQVRLQVLSLSEFYSGESRRYAQLDFRTELNLAVNFASLLIACRLLQALFFLRGPYAAPRIVARAIGFAGDVCTVSERSLTFLSPRGSAFRPDSAGSGAET